MTSLLLAIARMEGWLVPESRCRRNHNPGNIEAGRFSIAHGSTADDGRFAIFPSDAMGFEAMRALLNGPAYRGLTVAQALQKWAPSVENDTPLYTRLVCEWAGCRPSDALTPLLDAETVAV